MNGSLVRSHHRALKQAINRRRYATTQPPKKDKFNYNASPIFALEDDTRHTTYPRLTASQLALHRTPPKKVKMLARDFIHDSLYNPHYGYFPKNAIIFSPDQPFDFGNLKDLPHFQEEVAKRYAEYGVPTAPGEGPGRQVWHTPTELFKPWYGEAIAQCLVAEYMEQYFPYEDFIIYEMGAGNGTLAQNILDFIQREHPQVYERTRYRIIEISRSLAEAQRSRLRPHHPCVEVYNKSVFDWDTTVPAPCFFLALEVIDNFPHDVIRYSLDDLRPYQGVVAVDEHGDYSELYEPVHDPLIRQFLQLRHEAGHKSPALSSPFLSNNALRAVYRSIPFAPNVTPKPEFIPSRLLSFLKVLRQHFPLHRLLLSDFSSLPDAMPGYNSPVVQTRFRETMVPVETFMVSPGYFDIFFPTSFELLRDMYELVMSKSIGSLSLRNKTQARKRDDATGAFQRSPLASTASSARLSASFFTPHGRRKVVAGRETSDGLPVGQRMSSVHTHKDFMERYANLDGTRLRNGENPLLDYYRNVKFLF